ncbi:MAG: hypothetical protein JKP98_10505 [Rhodobacteraceae bacterium]|nr:hypothetical protein [Paracoccaceae bacterium]
MLRQIRKRPADMAGTEDQQMRLRGPRGCFPAQRGVAPLRPELFEPQDHPAATALPDCRAKRDVEHDGGVLGAEFSRKFCGRKIF